MDVAQPCPEPSKSVLCAGSPLSIGDQAIAGVGAGLAGAVIACPTELIKCRLQAQANTQPQGLIQTGAKAVGLAGLSQSDKGLASLVQAGAGPQGLSKQAQSVSRQQAAAGLAGLAQSGRGLAGLVKPGSLPQAGFSTLSFATATSGTTPGALHLGEITVSIPTMA